MTRRLSAADAEDFIAMNRSEAAQKENPVTTPTQTPTQTPTTGREQAGLDEPTGDVIATGIKAAAARVIKQRAARKQPAKAATKAPAKAPAKARTTLPEKGVRCRNRINGEYHAALIDEDVRGKWTWCRSCTRAFHAEKRAAAPATKRAPKRAAKQTATITQIPVANPEPDAHAIAAYATPALAKKAAVKRATRNGGKAKA